MYVHYNTALRFRSAAMLFVYGCLIVCEACGYAAVSAAAVATVQSHLAFAVSCEDQ
jgi:hypothetical protein